MSLANSYTRSGGQRCRFLRARPAR